MDLCNYNYKIPKIWIKIESKHKLKVLIKFCLITTWRFSKVFCTLNGIAIHRLNNVLALASQENIFTARKRSLRRLCFHRCLSVHGESTWAGTPRQVHPPATVHAGIRSTSGWYASHCNAFLFSKKKHFAIQIKMSAVVTLKRIDWPFLLPFSYHVVLSWQDYLFNNNNNLFPNK